MSIVSHDKNIHDSHTLPEVLAHIEMTRGKPVSQAVCYRGYQGKLVVNGVPIQLPKKLVKRDNRYQWDKKRKQCRRRAAIEPIIGHLKSDFRLSRNFLKGVAGDHVNIADVSGCLEPEEMAGGFFGLLYFLSQFDIATRSDRDSIVRNWTRNLKRNKAVSYVR